MSKPLAIASVAPPYGGTPQLVQVTRSRARAAGDHGVTFYAPGWRPLVARSLERAIAKLERHPGFQAWVSKPA